jgi:hypothetical protein
MAEGEVTSRQDGGAHMWTKAEVDATAAAGSKDNITRREDIALQQSASQTAGNCLTTVFWTEYPLPPDQIRSCCDILLC